METLLEALGKTKEDAIGFVHFGSCQFVTSPQRKKTLNQLRCAAQASWVSGYTTDIEWLPSMFLDLSLISHVFTPWSDDPKPHRKHGQNAQQFIADHSQMVKKYGLSALSVMTGKESLYPTRL
ncbi:MAG: hypothetical protein EA401_13835 [Planctomycetota bacterium]|nr:MAG: hypothetical protein EA401_13835 [Planctomycetota bacterium]